MPYMYMLECSDGSFYTGSTKNLPYRLWQHQNGLGANHTKKRLPVKLVYAEHYDRVVDAFYREKQVQGWNRKKKIALMNSDWDELHILAECQNESHYKNEPKINETRTERVALLALSFAEGSLSKGSRSPISEQEAGFDSAQPANSPSTSSGQRYPYSLAEKTRAERSRSSIAKTESQAIDREE